MRSICLEKKLDPNWLTHNLSNIECEIIFYGYVLLYKHCSSNDNKHIPCNYIFNLLALMSSIMCRHTLRNHCIAANHPECYNTVQIFLLLSC